MLRIAHVCLVLGALVLAAGCDDKKKNTTTAYQDTPTESAYTDTSTTASGSYGPETAGSAGSTTSTYDSGAGSTASYTAPAESTTTYSGAGESVSARPPSAGGRHTVAKGESLYSIARLYYNDQHRWKDIYNANKATIKDPNHLKAGQSLVIP